MFPGGYNPFWTQNCPAREFDGLHHHHDPHCTDGHQAGQCCECGRHARDYQMVRPLDPDPLDVTTGDDELIETIRDYETGARARMMVDSWPRKQGAALRFLKWRHERGDLS